MDLLQRDPNSPTYEADGISLAVLAHADIIRIHPFEDGNGRTSRLLLNCILVRLGFLPISVDAVREEYRECLNYYYRSTNPKPLIDLFLALYPLE